MNRCYALAALVVFSLMPGALCAAPAPSHADEIQALPGQYGTAPSPERRKQIVSELKSLVKSSADADVSALNAAVAAMLPEAASTWEAEELLAIGAAIPEAAAPDRSGVVRDPEFLVDARRASAEAGSANGDVEALADIRVDRLQQDNEGGALLPLSHVQQVWRINNSRGAKSFSPRSVVYSGSSETLCMMRARVLKSNGGEEAAAISADRPVLKREAAMYFDSRSRELRFAHLQPGDLVEVEYLLLPRAEASPWTGYYARIDQFKQPFPSRLQRRVLIAPSSIQLYVVTRGLSPAMEQQQDGEAVRVWEARGSGPQTGAVQPYLHVSTIGSIQEFGRWYSQLLEPTLQLDGGLQSVANKIAARKLSPQGKVEAVYETVKRTTKYAGFEFGVHSFQPYPVSLVERRGFGDCKDKAAMLVALLRAVGVEAEFAMVRTRSAGELAEGAYSAQQFDHALVYVPELNLYLDGTAESADPLPDGDLGAMAVTVDAQGNATRRTVLASAPQFAGTHPALERAGDGRSAEIASHTNLGASMATEQRP